MLPTYPAILRDDHLEWTGDRPCHLPPGLGVQVHVTVVDPTLPAPAATQGERMAAALQKLAASQSLREMPDPAAWEREIRQDRSLPERAD